MKPTRFEVVERDVITPDWLDNRATVERRNYAVSHGQAANPFEIILITPNDRPNAPVIITQNFSSNRSVVARDGESPLPGEARSMGPLGSIFGYFFGRYIVEHPYENILDRGYAVAVMHPPDYVPDRKAAGVERLKSIFPDAGESRPGALTVWASLTIALADELKADVPERSIIAYGHSRYGKTALIAAALSDNIDSAVSHQSGTVGASIMRDKTGESLKDIVTSYPQWVTPLASDYTDDYRSLPVDAPALLAAIAPKPILLGNARRDVWSDPEGAYRAAKIAAPVWGADSFTAERLDDFQPADDIAFWIRPGTHGVVKEDWPAFLDFLDAHFK
ncbi:hypothetical protein [Litorimonas sp. WD9-15]|uniref:glucuronyl esterase domain-containing protein n=1 Tax=Litorimonas sp. WD9-15 TaxID=3418716 RepID=UPI003D08A594